MAESGAGISELTTFDGTREGLKVTYKLSQIGDLPVLPRIGLDLVLDGALDTMEWYGLGPHESYPDRKSSVRVGRWSRKVSDQYEPQVMPQDCGNKEEVRWVSFTDAEGRGARFAFEKPISVKALHFSAQDLHEAKHMHELRPRDEVFVSLDAFVLGLGGASCGPPPLERYRRAKFPITMSFTVSAL